MGMGTKYRFERCECLGPQRRFNFVIPAGTWVVDEDDVSVKIILGYRAKELDKSAFYELKAEKKAIPA
jgi:hypothetical protein